MREMGGPTPTIYPVPPRSTFRLPTDVSAELTGLTSFTNYRYHLIPGRSDGEGLLESR